MAEPNPAPDQADATDHETEPEVASTATREGGASWLRSNEVKETTERFSFLLQALIWMVLDGLFLLGAFVWLHWVDTNIHHGGLHGWQSVLFTWCRGALEATPLVLVAVHTLLDFFGAVRRMVERRL